MNDKIVLVSGANSGIGYIAAREIAGMGAKVILLCRNQAKGQQAVEDILKAHPSADLDLQLCDLSSKASIREAGMSIRAKYDHIDVLLNNAGGIFGSRKESVDGLEMTFGLDHMGYFLLTHYLLDLVAASDMKRIVNVASGAHKFLKEIHWDDLQSEKKYSEIDVYAQAKTFNILFTRELAERVLDLDITVNNLHPGMVKTNFGAESSAFMKFMMIFFNLMAISPEKGAETSIYLATSNDPEVTQSTGKYFDKKKAVEPSSLATDPQSQKRLWAISEELGGIKNYGKVEESASA